MNTTKISRSEVMTAAHSMRRQNPSLTFGDCQKLAWKSIRLRSALRTGIINFCYTKENGEMRKATGTLNATYFQYESKGTDRTENPMIVKYYDLDAGAFRSCRADRLIAA